MTYMMKKERAFWASVCLLLSVTPGLLNALPEEVDEHSETTDSAPLPMKPKQTFCAMKVEDGPCKAMIRSYFFNILTQQCEEFIYGGCRGNENRFETVEECKAACLPGYKKTPVKTISARGKPDFCFLEEDPGICRGLITRYFYNNQSKQCERFKYGGCLGNQNNFETLDACRSTCEDTVNELPMGNHVPERNTVNNTLITQSTKSPNGWVTKEGTNGGWKNADCTYQVFLNIFCLHVLTFLSFRVR
ncbi:tissue factor pathway inhibitor isoform X2 [Microtus oregoni]|uniref:tissue factor pathway inhibitor isoform X2 n=1 Tax=Microtus oregoni TaxID=111838 RepID=UPI001BB10938|nr:tissue factor pathway inhibitor isoform X2 [Microtus oregoni]